jgi:pimeloyl-ACP methyl ester carboxylesterase
MPNEITDQAGQALASAIIGILAIATVSCATAPAKVRRVGLGPEKLLSSDKSSLGGLIEVALEDTAAERSNHALAHFVERWKRERGGAGEGVVSVEAKDGSARRYRISFERGFHGSYPLSYFDEISPAVDYRVEKIPHHRRDGVGAPLVAVRENRKQDAIEAFFPPEAITRALTAVVGSSRKVGDVVEVDIQLLCPLRNDEIIVDGKSVPLAADFTVPWAALLARAGDLERSRYLDPLRRKPKREPQLYLMEDYDPKKEPLILIHGLFDSPLVWAKLSNELWADETVRERYQIWHYLYNTSAPALYSGRILRTQLREVRPLLDPTGRDPAMRSTTVIAHSMGGIITRSLITRPGNAFWDAAFTQSFDSLTLSDADRDSLREAFFWEPESHVRRVIYIAASHRGSNFADNFVGRLGRFVVHPPNQFAAFYNRISAANPGAFTQAYVGLGKGKLNSVHALSPKQPTLKILADLPNSHRVATHSIIGNRGLPGPIEDSSDGIVEYWSSHVDNADSEKIVPSDHYAMNHPDTVLEIKRILKLKRIR